MNLGMALEIQSNGPQPEFHDLPWLAKMAKGCETILELGTLCGASTRAMLDNSDAHIWCVDSWRGSGRTGPMKGLVATEKDYLTFLENIHDVKDRVTILKMFTREAVDLLPMDFFDMIFIDADHSYEAVKFDILNFAHKVRSGGLLCGHDYDKCYTVRDGLVKAVKELITNPRQAGQSIWWTTRVEGWLRSDNLHG